MFTLAVDHHVTTSNPQLKIHTHTEKERERERERKKNNSLAWQVRCNLRPFKLRPSDELAQTSLPISPLNHSFIHLYIIPSFSLPRPTVVGGTQQHTRGGVFLFVLPHQPLLQLPEEHLHGHAVPVAPGLHRLLLSHWGRWRLAFRHRKTPTAAAAMDPAALERLTTTTPHPPAP